MGKSPVINFQLEIDLKNDDMEAKKERARKVAKVKEQSLNVTEDDWKEVFGRKNTKADTRRLKEVYKAWKAGKILPNGKFSKAEALRMWKRLSEMQREQKLKDLVTYTPDNYILIQNEIAFQRMVSHLEGEPIFALDTETTGLDMFGDDELVGISLTLPEVDYHYYIPVAHDEGKQLDRDRVLKRLKPYIEDPNKKKVLHNAKFDAHVLLKYGVRLRGLEADTMVLMWILNENEMNYKLKDLATKYLKEPADTFAELFGKNTKFNTVPLDIALAYAGKDTDVTWKLYQFQMKHLSKPKLAKAKKLYFDIENGVVDVCINMEQTGFVMDLDFAEKYGAELHAELEEVEVKLYEHFPKDINFNSPKQLQELFYGEWDLPDVSGKQSTNAETLEKLNEETEHDGIKALLSYRNLTKLIGTYVDKLPNEIKNDGRLHGQFRQMGTVTGRFASSNPNLQNIPPLARKLFVAPAGKLIVGSDYSQIEPRVLAHISGDEHLREPYILGRDLYSTLASKVFKLPIEECGDGTKWRKMMKVGLLAVMYGTSMYTLAKQLKITVEEAEEFINDFFDEYPKVGAWIKSIHESVKKNEYVETMFGRKRRFPGHREKAIIYDKKADEIRRILGTEKLPTNIWDDKYKKILPYRLKREFQNVKGSVERVRRMAVNAIIQGSSADIMKMALIEVDRLAQNKGWGVFATVHDEILLYVNKDVTESDIQELEQAMTGVVELEVPLKVDVMFTDRWGDSEINKAEFFSNAS